MYEELAMYIDGEWCQGSEGAGEEVVNPATEEALAHLPHAATADLDRALDGARRGFEVWRNTSAYDRAGMGWSEAGPEPRDSNQYASELAALLDKAGEDPPYLLVGHSLGGHTIRIFADQHPDQVVGLVLVDARLTTGELPSGGMSDSSLRLWGFLARCGFFRVVGSRALMMQAPTMYEKIPDYPMPIAYDPLYFQTSLLQGPVIEDSDRQAEKTGPFGDLPLAVIIHGLPGKLL